MTLASDLGGARVSGIIVETEAYLGVHDPASHAWRGRRHRLNLGIWGPTNAWYVYRSYGIHWCVNLVVTAGENPGAVLIRAMLPHVGLETIRERRRGVRDRDLANGPGKVGQALAVTGEHDGMLNAPDAPLRLEPRIERVSSARILVTPRVGISRAVDWPLRFLLRPPTG
jgi:DNA-3-methyladenine glycosylase